LRTLIVLKALHILFLPSPKDNLTGSRHLTILKERNGEGTRWRSGRVIIFQSAIGDP
jgi:hypothetical protein